MLNLVTDIPRKAVRMEAPPLVPTEAGDPKADAAAAPAFVIEWRPMQFLHAVVSEWRALAARAIEPNVFYEPAFAMAAAAPFGEDAGAFLVWSQTSSRLLGFFPGRLERNRYGIPLPVFVGWTHSYAPLGTPLVDCDKVAAVIAAFLAHLARDPALPKLILLPYLPDEGPFAQTLDCVVARYGGHSARFAGHQRALLAPQGERTGYFEHALSAKKRRELRRQQQLLEKDHEVRFAIASEPIGIRAALQEFLALEARGWKGRAGTAAASKAETERFLTAAITGLAAEGKAQVHRLLAGDEAVAAGVTLRSGDTAWFWKIAYDEAFARSSPGIQLTIRLSEALLADATLKRADSCATAHHPMMDHLWRERLALSDRLVTVGAEAGLAFAFAARLEALRRGAYEAAKSIYHRLRGR